MKKIFALVLLCIAIACKEDEMIKDDIAEYVSFSGSNFITIGEADDNIVGYPLTAQLWAFEPYNEDITLTFQVTGSNATSGVDYLVSPSTQITIKAGKLLSDTIWVKTVNGEVGNDLERTFEVELVSASQSSILLGLGSETKKNLGITFKITDDDCSGSPICVFNQSLINNVVKYGDPYSFNAVGVVDKINNTVTVSGDLIEYAEFDLVITLTPDSPGASTGVASIGAEQEVGTAWDGYDYKFIETASGTYDASTGKISIAYDIYYLDGGQWWYWFSVTNDFQTP